MKKISLTEKILEVVSEGVVTAAQIVTAVLESGYGASYSKMDRIYSRIENERLARKIAYQERQRFSNLLSKLKREGLVDGNERLKITKLGKKRLLSLRSKVRAVPTSYTREADAIFKIVIFDIPEKEKRKREWLREVLVNLGLRMLQKSVWIGKVKIPEEFIQDLKNLKLLSCVHIFSTDKLGSISEELGDSSDFP